MNTAVLRCITLFFLTLSVSVLSMAAQEKPERRHRPTPLAAESPLGQIGASRPGVSRGASISPIRTPTPAINQPTAGSSTSNIGYPSIPIQTYTPQQNWNRSVWNRCGHFYYRLHMLFGSFPVQEYLWRFAQGDSALTPRAIEMALNDSSLVAENLRSAALELRQIILDYQADHITQDQFENGVDRATDTIRDLSKKIRKDFFVDFIDQGREVDLGKSEKVASIPELLALSNELTQLSSQLRSDFDYYQENDVTRVIDVSALQKPSFESLSKGIDRLAKVIENSADRL